MKPISLLLLVVGLTGCLPLVSPPIHAKLGAAYSSKPIDYATTIKDVTTTGTTQWPGYVAAGLDTADVTELPFNIASGVMGSFGDWGGYVEAGVIRRVVPHLRIGANGGTEYWADGDGMGLRTGVTVEYTGHDMAFVGSKYNRGNDGTHNQSTTYYAAKGSFAVGGFIDVGHRWVRDEPNNTYVSMGLSFRLPALIGFLDVSGMH